MVTTIDVIARKKKKKESCDTSCSNKILEYHLKFPSNENNKKKTTLA
jgi:hypothetical protein